MKVTVAVVINEVGDWYAWGGSNWTKEQARREVEGQVCEPYVLHYVEAEVPLPTPQTFQGKVCQNDVPSLTDTPQAEVP